MEIREQFARREEEEAEAIENAMPAGPGVTVRAGVPVLAGNDA